MSMRVAVLSLCLAAVVGCGGAEAVDESPLGTNKSQLVVPTVENQVVARLASSTGAPYGYAEYLPPGYLTSTSSYPVVIHLNGKDEFGTSTTEADLLSVLTRNGALNLIQTSSTWKTYFGTHQVMVFSPRAPAEWSPAVLDSFVDFLVANYRVDPTRIYLTGLSLGGYGAWKYAYDHGSRLAALAPMATNIGGPGPSITQLQNVPVWAVHTYADGTSLSAEVSWLIGLTKLYGQYSPVSVASPSTTVTYPFDAATHAWGAPVPGLVGTGSSIARLTVYPGISHNCWEATYGDTVFWDWMFAQHR
ncbi:phospholipase [Corallococcus sp. M34]|uniref:carboxylesterase family protein n=1 Tax=Citreicoccus inhibens TaxID=2849499 RepID=UPI001C22F554|nr:PHB depolymerase family esterase [Citreicoccus inhibens]MBU8894169.1 phospholipase [Citreicoccus inhibens]